MGTREGTREQAWQQQVRRLEQERDEARHAVRRWTRVNRLLDEALAALDLIETKAEERPGQRPDIRYLAHATARRIRAERGEDE